jgi:nucleotide-binding universal stress UspA family protein
MFKVLIAIDGSEIGRRTLDYARDLLAQKDAAVTLFHVIPQHMIYGRAVAPVEVYDMPKERAASNRLLEESEKVLRAGGVGPSIDRRISVGDPADLILTAASDLDADLIIMGSRGLNAASRFLIGSTSTRVTTHAHCAVLVVHPKGSSQA